MLPERIHEKQCIRHPRGHIAIGYIIQSKGLTGRKTGDRLNVAKVMEDFKKSQDSSSHRSGILKIDAPFEKALDTILEAKPDPKKTKASHQGGLSDGTCLQLRKLRSAS